MGCDIHFYAEVKENGVWKSVDKWEYEDGWMGVRYNDSFYNDRNYDLFAILADVRNGYGFAGCETGFGFNPIASPRGLPDNISEEVAQCSEQWDGDGHSHSWLTLKELQEFDWDQVTTHIGYVSQDEFITYIKTGSPKSWCGGTSSTIISNEDMMQRVKDKLSSDAWSVMTKIQWSEKYSDCVGFFITETMPKLESLGNSEDVRVVFWFDN